MEHYGGTEGMNKTAAENVLYPDILYAYISLYIVMTLEVSM